MEGWTAHPDGVTVTTPDGRIEADRLVLAPGAWAPSLVRLDIPMRVERRVQHYWRGVDPSLYVPGRLPVWIWQYGTGEAGYGLPTVDGAVKAGLHNGSETVDPDVGSAPVRAEEVSSMRSWLSTRLPGLADGEWLGSKPCLYTLTPDEHFVLGPHPEHDNVWVACGFSGHGFKFIPVVGEILATALSAPVSPSLLDASLALFSPARARAGIAEVQTAGPAAARACTDPLPLV